MARAAAGSPESARVVERKPGPGTSQPLQQSERGIARHLGLRMRLRREALWIAGSAVAATAFCWLSPDYGFSPVPFFTGLLYLITGAIRFLLGWLNSSN